MLRLRSPKEEAKRQAMFGAAGGGIGGLLAGTEHALSLDSIEPVKKAGMALGDNVLEIRPGASMSALRKFLIKNPNLLRKLSMGGAGLGVGATIGAAIGAGGGYLKGHIDPSLTEE